MDSEPEIFDAEIIESPNTAESPEVVEAAELVDSRPEPQTGDRRPPPSVSEASPFHVTAPASAATDVVEAEPIPETFGFPLYVVHPQFGKVDGSQSQLQRAAERLAAAPEGDEKFSLLDSLNQFPQLDDDSRRAVLARIDLLGAAPRLKARAENFAAIASRCFPGMAGCGSGAVAVVGVASLWWFAPDLQSLAGALLLSFVGVCALAVAFGLVRDFRIRRWFRCDLVPDAERRGVDPALLYASLLVLSRRSNWAEGLVELAKEAEALGRTMLRCGKLAPPTLRPPSYFRSPAPPSPRLRATHAESGAEETPIQLAESDAQASTVELSGDPPAPALHEECASDADEDNTAHYFHERLAPAQERREQVARLADEVGATFPHARWRDFFIEFAFLEAVAYYLLPEGKWTVVWLAVYGITACWAVSLGDRSWYFAWEIRRWLRKTFLPATRRYGFDPNAAADELRVLPPSDAALSENARLVVSHAESIHEALFDHRLSELRRAGALNLLDDAPRALSAAEEDAIRDGLARMTAKPLRSHPADQASRGLVASLAQWEQLSRAEQEDLIRDVQAWVRRQEARQGSLKELADVAASHPRPFYGWRGVLLFLTGVAPIVVWPDLRDRFFTPLIFHAAWIGSVYGDDIWRNWRLARWKRKVLLPRVRSGALDVDDLARFTAGRHSAGWRFLQRMMFLADEDSAPEQFRYVIRNCSAAASSRPASS